MNLYSIIAIIASRAASKSFIIAIFACCRAILYPGSLVVIASGTKGQGKLIVSEKIQSELMRFSPVLKYEIESIRTTGNEVTVNFRNTSKITVVPATDNARGHRSNCFVFEEFRMIQKRIVDSVLLPFQVVRTPAYALLPEYADMEHEEPINIYISSPWFKSHWMWKSIVRWAKSFINDNSALLLAFDYSITLKHKIKTKKQLLKDKAEFDPLTWRIEMENEMVSENTNGFFSYEMLAKNQRMKRALYPQASGYGLSKQKSSDIKKQPGEIRVLSCDMAFVTRKGNDNSIYSILRLLPETTTHRVGSDDELEVKNGYRKQVAYLEGIQGGDTVKQAIRIKQLYYDADCDYIVLDVRNGGIAVYDMLARVLYDEDRGIEYPAWQCMNDSNIAARIQVAGALPVLFAVTASKRLNSDIATITRKELLEERVDLLIPHSDAIESVLPKMPEYQSSLELEKQFFYEAPYVETQALINEMVELVYDIMPQTGIIQIQEQDGNHKDRYTSVSYGLYFASLLEQDMLSEQDEYDSHVFIN